MSEIEDIDPFAGVTVSDSEEEIEQVFEAPARPVVAINYQYTPGVKTHFCCQVDRDIHSEDTVILITDAQKTTDSSGSSYITYTVNVGEKEVNRRYSEFESLRKGLMRLYPTLIVPPIPEKHSIADYATLQNKAKEDIAMIEKRKRMLQSFLNRVSSHPQLSDEHVFHKFLETGVSWNEVLHSPPLSNLPKNILQASPANLSSSSPTSSTAQQAVLPNPSASQHLKNPDPQFVESEAFTNKFAYHISQNLEKTNKRTWKRLNDLSTDYAELGAIYNGFSLNEHGELSNAIEKISLLEAEFSEPLQEYSQFSQVIKQVLKYRHLKHLQMELTAETLEKQRLNLETLENSEQEAKRLEEALTKERGIRDNSVPNTQPNPDGENNENLIGENDQAEEQSQNGDLLSLPEEPKSHQKRRSGSKLFSVLSHTIHGIIDVDPEATRRNSIGKTRDSIIQLEEALVTTTEDLKNISVSIQSDLDRFQRQKIRDLKNMLINYAKTHVEWCQKNLTSWEEAKTEVEKIQT
ncbi:14682_t:CDS:2 [Funneliformis geosporum]|uniref:17414_t:CDS:1 n=1 Tax=Funneliformis geosporum TaxID=1117311 RepID=A0A9W4SUC9_9GLOM|nr:14682_t:CDS:2 [Funneliformis geosporum]CAI2183502.1 17414_t:CDS:2 [Funneliformis geosporum]